MAGRSPRPYLFLFMVSQALCVLRAVQPASAQVPLPPNFISPDVPHDAPFGPSTSIQDLAIFAWREFIALNWVAMDPATTGVRGRPNVNMDFLSIKPDLNGNFPLVVWHTYRHKNELFPFGRQTDAVFDSNMPTYNYQFQPGAGYMFPPASPPAASPNATFNLFNNLDETSEIGLCDMYAQPPSSSGRIRVAYEAKVNRAVFDYANNNKLTERDNNGNYTTLNATISWTKGNLAQYGGICSTDSSIVSLPCGDAATAGDAGEGAIEIKAAWRQLTDQEAASGRFFKQSIIFYSGAQFTSQQTYNNAVYGLIALHIIHKTKSFPTFVFATWEQIDNYNDTSNENTEDLQFTNVLTKLPNIPVTRAHPIHSQIPPVNDAVHAAFTAKDPTTIWQYYKLIGVQATPVNGPPPPPATMDDLSYYYLANIVVETNQTLQNFAGTAPTGVVAPFLNVYLNGASGSPFQMGGCQGCHGTQGQAVGGDMSRLIAAAPSNSNLAPESIDADEAAAVKSYLERSKDVIHR
jgi:hypothetical protein